MSNPTTSDLSRAKKVLEVEAQCILAAKEKLNETFLQAIEAIEASVKQGGKVVVMGIGKSGKIAAKIAATLASTGTPAIFLHATEGAHGDLGIVRHKDVALAISYSGSSEEILKLVPSLRNLNVKIVSIVGNMKSPLAQNSDWVIDGSVTKEACPLNLAPTSSTTVALSLGDALAMVLSERLDFKEEQFATTHPAGALGRRLTLRVRDLMKKEDALPWISEDASMQAVIEVTTEKKLGAVLVHAKNESKTWVGLITDGDIRRALHHKDRFFQLLASDIMTKSPVSIQPDEKAIRALELMENRPSQISVLPVVDAQGNCVGLVRLHDLIGSL